MSVLVHQCRRCGHRESWHEPRERAYTSCRCCRDGAPDPDPEPNLADTFTVPGWRLEPLYQPGAQRNSGSMHTTECCACARCREVYAHLTGPAPAEHTSLVE